MNSQLKSAKEARRRRLERVAELRDERSQMIASLVRAKNMDDELRLHRIGNLEREVARVNAEISRLQERTT